MIFDASKLTCMLTCNDVTLAQGENRYSFRNDEAQALFVQVPRYDVFDVMYVKFLFVNSPILVSPCFVHSTSRGANASFHGNRQMAPLIELIKY